MTRAAALKSQGKMKAPPAAPGSDEKPAGEEGKPPSEAPSGAKSKKTTPTNPTTKTDPPASRGKATSSPKKPSESPEKRAEASDEPAPSEASETPGSSSSMAAADLPPSATLPPTPALLLGTAKAEGRVGGSAGETAGPAMLELLLRELQHLRANQEKMLELLGQGPSRTSSPSREPESDPERPEETVLSPVRSRRRKTVLLIDDDKKTRDAAVAELEQADVPVRAVEDGNEALRLIAEEKPDVIALELALGGEMAAKDLVNTVKATMEWVDIPIVLWTREPVATQKDARITHGADELVHKKSGPAALVTRVITLFRRA